VAQNLIYGSLAVSIGMILAYIADIATGMPFGGNLTPDIIFIIAAAIVGWMAIDCLRGIRRRK